jgi:hypothetical protein
MTIGPIHALFLGGRQHGRLLSLEFLTPYYDFPAIHRKISVAMNQQLPDEVMKTDRDRYKVTMVSVDKKFALYTECGDAIHIFTRVRDWVVSDKDIFYGRKPEPVFLNGRGKP